MTITKETTIIEALQAHPRVRDIFVLHGMGCIGCMGAAMESIENGAKMHGVDAEALVRDINALLVEK